ncbi:MAG: hydroxymethylbilane synthase [Flavobacteriales bacterium]|nr:hydroxymethylbilane synthase [Flavobacteriales bacterium]
MRRKIIIGSRGSDLALWQAHHVEAQLKLLGHEIEIKIIKTQGDRIQHLSFDKLEGKGFFTKELEEKLLSKEIDLAVHSHKDLPTENPKGLIIAAVSEREDPADMLFIRKEKVDTGRKLHLVADAVVGTSSARRKSQLLHHRSDVEIKELRGNVPTRINKLREGQYDAIMLAAAGVKRLKLDLTDLYVLRLDPKEFIPAPAQGVLGLQIREKDSELNTILQHLNSPKVARQIGVERRILNLFDGGCQMPLGAYCEADGTDLKVISCVADAWNSPIRISENSGENVEALAQKTVADLKD